MTKIGFVTCEDLKRYFVSEEDSRMTHDDLPAARGLASRGFEIQPIKWGVPASQLTMFDLLIIRSPWDYMESLESYQLFCDWLKSLEAARIPVQNPVGMMLWNLDKHYLADLEKKGIPIVATEFVEGDAIWTEDCLRNRFRAQGAYVIKPCASAAAKDTFLIDREEVEACLHEKNGDVTGPFDDWRRNRSFIVQPFLSSIRTHGEWSLIFFGNHYSHGVRKRPPADGWLVQDELGGTLTREQPPESVCEVAQAAVKVIKDLVGSTPLYARVDVLQDNKQRPVVGELELVEPELFFLSRAPLPVEPYLPAIDAFCAEVEAKLIKSSKNKQL